MTRTENSLQNYIDRMPFGTQKWIAEKAGLTIHTVNRLYKGRHKASTDTAKKIAAVTGLTVEGILANQLSDQGIVYHQKQKAKRVAAKAAALRTELLALELKLIQDTANEAEKSRYMKLQALVPDDTTL